MLLETRLIWLLPVAELIWLLLDPDKNGVPVEEDASEYAGDVILVDLDRRLVDPAESNEGEEEDKYPMLDCEGAIVEPENEVELLLTDSDEDCDDEITVLEDDATLFETVLLVVDDDPRILLG